MKSSTICAELEQATKISSVFAHDSLSGLCSSAGGRSDLNLFSLDASGLSGNLSSSTGSLGDKVQIILLTAKDRVLDRVVSRLDAGYGLSLSGIVRIINRVDSHSATESRRKCRCFLI